MNLWIKVGVPVLIAALLLISAVSITVAMNATSTGNRVSAASYDSNIPGGGRVAAANSCDDCPRNGNCDQGDCNGYQGNCGGGCGYGGTTGGCQGNCKTGAGQSGYRGIQGQSTDRETYISGCCGAR